jgi:hypothetical protein
MQTMRSSTDNRATIQNATNATEIDDTATMAETASPVENGMPRRNEHHTKTNAPTADHNPSTALFHTRQAQINFEHLLIDTMTVIKTNEHQDSGATPQQDIKTRSNQRHRKRATKQN